MSAGSDSVAGVLERFQPERIRDDMIGVARALADRDCGAMQSEMRAAQIEFVATTLADYRETVTADLVEAAKLALELIEHIQDEEGHSPSTAVPAVALRAALAKARSPQ